MRFPAAGSPVWVIGHRGASEQLPDNTFAAFDAAVEAGCDAIELDVQLSRDGVPVVFHDRTLVRAGGGRRRVAGLDRAELARLDAGARFDALRSRQHIPTLDEVLDRYGGSARLLIEIKTREGRGGGERHRTLMREVAREVTRRKFLRSVAVLCFESTLLDEARTVAPGLARVLNLRAPRRLGARLRETLAGIDALSIDVRTLSHGFAAAVRDAGCPILAYTCNTARRVELSLDCGAVGIMTDRPAWLAGRLRAGDARR